MRCTKCEEDLSEDKFWKNCRWCKVCMYETSKVWRKTPEGQLSMRNTQYKKKYGIEFQDFLDLIDQAGGECEICGTELVIAEGKGRPPNRACLDHDHNTGEIRGVLCSKCNKGIGLLMDSPENLKKALDYLEK